MDAKFLELIERTLDEVLPNESERPAALSSAMRHAVGSGGKRIRPLITLASAIACSGTAEDARYPAAAIELLHNYTLIHDDLPAMDNDVERRGKPTVWKKFGEAAAILAGDALQALAFKTAALAPKNAAKVSRELAKAAFGVVSGQVEDIEHTKDVAYIYEHKTADLFIAAAKMGGYAAGAPEGAIAALGDFALNLGLAFQYEDDILDGDSPYPREKTEALAKETTREAIAALSRLPGDTSLLAGIASSLLGRSR